MLEVSLAPEEAVAPKNPAPSYCSKKACVSATRKLALLMQNVKMWNLMSGSDMARIFSTSLQMMLHLFRTYSGT
jgi:hypothetical protein